MEYLIEPVPEEVVWCYSEYQQAYYEMQQWSNVEFCEGMPDLEKLKSAKQKAKLLILDDLMQSKQKEKLTEIYTKGSHHYNLSVLTLVQNIFYSGLRTARINSHYLVLLKNPSDKLQVANLAKQLYPQNSRHLIESYHDATKDPYTYLLIDLHQLTPDLYRLRSKIFPSEITVIYVPI